MLEEVSYEGNFGKRDRRKKDTFLCYVLQKGEKIILGDGGNLETFIRVRRGQAFKEGRITH